MPCLKGGEDRADTGSTAGREREAMTLGMTSLQRVVNTRKLLMFRNREWVVNVFSVELAVNLQVYVQPKVVGLVFLYSTMR